MAKRGKSINLFLMDGEASGRIKCTLANWTGIAYKIPRTALDSCKQAQGQNPIGQKLPLAFAIGNGWQYHRYKTMPPFFTKGGNLR